MAKMKAAFEELPAPDKEAVEGEADGYGVGRGSQPVAETTVAYVRYPGGALGRIVVTGELGEVAAGGVEISKEAYDAELAALDAGHAAHLADVVAADESNTLADYRELRTAGVADASARRMSGYSGDTPGDLA